MEFSGLLICCGRLQSLYRTIAFREEFDAVLPYCGILAAYLRRLSIAIVVCVVSSAAAQELPVVKTVAEVHRLNSNRLEEGVLIDLECVVMCYEPDWSILFVYDGQNGFYVGDWRNLSLSTGDQIRLRGRLNRSRVPVEATFEKSNNGIELPSPKKVEFDWLMGPHEDSQFVEIEGQLVGIAAVQSQAALEMRSSDGGRFRGLIGESKVDEQKTRGMLGKKLKLRGVVGARFDELQRWVGFQIWLAEPHNIVEVESPGEPFEIPKTPIAELTADRILETKSSYFRTSGLITHQISPSMVLLEDETHHLFVELSEPTSVQLDHAYDVSGTLDTSIVPPVLRMGVFSPTDEKFMVATPALSLAVAELVAGDFSGQWVRTEGTYAGAIDIRGQRGFLLQAHGNLLPVFVDEPPRQEIAAGTSVDVTGIWIQQKSLVGFNIGSCALHARTEGVRFGTQVPWLLLSALGLAGSLTALSGVWVWTLRKQVRRKTQEFLDSVAEKRKTEERMLSMQKMESLGVLAGGIAHDFNNLLTIIVGNASILQSSGKLGSEERSGLCSIQEAASRAAELTQQMLAYAGRGRFDVRVVDVSKLVSEMSSLLVAAVSKNIQFDFCLQEKLPGVKADATQLKQILLNLVRNASESMEGRHGVIRIQSRMLMELPESKSSNCFLNFTDSALKHADGFVCLEVSDNGSGIEESVLPSIFDPFFTTKFSGRGLGLSTVIGIVKNHLGCLDVQSKKGEGTSLSIFLPACAEPATSVGAPHFIKRPLDTPFHVVVVDDEPSILRVISKALDQLGMQITTCSSGEEVIELLTDDQHRFDCLISDLTMPTMGGVELCKAIDEMKIGLPIILCTGYSLSLAESSKEAPGVRAVLQKPFKVEELVRVVQEVLVQNRKQSDLSTGAVH